MDLPVMTMERTEARKLFLEYRDSVRELADRELEAIDERKAAALARQREIDTAIMGGYRLLSLGRQIINLRDTIIAGGVDEEHRPRLAVARADNQRVGVSVGSGGSVRFVGGWQRRDHRNPRTADQISFEAGTLPRYVGAWVNATAIVPLIPPRFRPRELDHYHLLWEADWTKAPVDPALLRALGGGLYAVVAVWDLTEIERSVLALR